ncbi:SLC13 family permease [Rhizobiales bacterium]|uniref:SLC13 family permease n=1 Tax=Hongsoonwoonella zoysiae TaxID=2821844 RepID=UPI00155F5833|nr:SLC13 family permease [Hongsoonwoonella zoysiae]NRG18395.1 SLC13 family permease [Hongsoonwoonella zoysiae]
MSYADLPMVLTMVVILMTIVLYAFERIAIELIALGSVVALIVIFSLFPVETPSGPLGAESLLAGFSNPALLTVIALLVVGQGLFQTDALEKPAQVIVRVSRRKPWLAGGPILIAVAIISAFLNNTPVVVMFLPILSAVAVAQGTSSSRYLMPLSFIAILGGMMTLIGSSTNLLVANVARQTSDVHLTFFSFTPLGALLAGVGAIYVLVVMPFLLKPRKTMADELAGASGKQFIAQINITHGHPLVGATAVSGLFPELKDMTVRLVQRGERPILPPFENVTLSPGDTVIVAATRSALTQALSRRNPLMATESGDQETSPQASAGSLTLAEVVVAPASRLISRTLAQTGFHTMTGCVVMGIQRRSRMPRMAMNDIRLEAGDVLLVAGTREDIKRLRGNRDVLLLDWSATELPKRRHAPTALAIFIIMVAAAASGLVPIVSAALAGTFAMIVTGCLNIRQALRAIDSRIFMLIGASIAAATALEATQGAALIANGLVALMEGQPPAVYLSGLFLLVMLLTNVLSNNAAAVLFTPIAVRMANQIGMPPEAFVVCVIFAANCSFATPIGYQTNLIVMGPGHYRFSDFIVAGIPLALLLWITFTLSAPMYYGLS